MLNAMVWAMMTGGITVAVWIGIVLVRRQNRRMELQDDLLVDVERRTDRLEEASDRLLEVDQRLDALEHGLTAMREPARLPPET